jgi:hypothetical protein
MKINNNRRRKKLNANWTTPLCLALDKEEAIANKLAVRNAGGLQVTFDHNPTAAALGFGTPGLP